MDRLRGSATIFYSTHILDDVQRVSDHVAILDKGRLVVTDATQSLLSRFTPERIVVTVRGATNATSAELRQLPGVVDVRDIPAEPGLAAYELSAASGALDDVQRAVTRWAVTADVALVSNAAERLDLEDVFLRLIDTKERAA
jgi:ABC-2 type transport system ATP-binding protein